ncbi:hypothetical protein HYU18_01775 [Candidatus Woesearchaeota archaeon]|nr:hypothetical protein [Candidatus Woesearchaeota archaeon]
MVKPKGKAIRSGQKASLRERLLSVGSGASGLMGIFSSWAVCHNVCTAAIAFLAVMGVTVTGMPLLFLQSVAVPLWTAAVALLVVLLILKIRKMGCLSTNALMLNGGIIIFGMPLQALQDFILFFRLAGGAVILVAAARLLKTRLKRYA